MKAISLWQPWASAIGCGSKRVETRPWSTLYRGPLAIHASKRLRINELISIQNTWSWRGALRGAGFNKLTLGDKDLDEILPFGAIVAVCRVVDCRPTGSFTGDEIDSKRRPAGEISGLYDWNERQMGDFRLGRFGWILEDLRRLKTPVPFDGSQRFFDVPDELIFAAGMEGVCP